MLERKSPIPLYYQLKERLKKMIRAYKPGRRIPSENELSNMFSVSRPTVRQALQELVSEGKIEKRKGEGSFVSKPEMVANSLVNIMSLAQQMDEMKLNYSTRVIAVSKRKAVGDIAENLAVSAGTPIVYLERLRFLNAEPFYLSQSYLLNDLCKDVVNADLETYSLFAYLLEKCHLTMTKVKRFLEPVAADKYCAQMLNVSLGSPIHYLQTFSFDEDERLWGYFRDHFRGDRSRFAFTIVKMGNTSVTMALPSQENSRGK
jgi:GntR family transcriptional regulator